MHAICVQIFRHIAQKSLAIRQYACGISVQSAEKSDYASYAQALFSVSLKNFRTDRDNLLSVFFDNYHKSPLPVLCSIFALSGKARKKIRFRGKIYDFPENRLTFRLQIWYNGITCRWVRAQADTPVYRKVAWNTIHSIFMQEVLHEIF